MAVPQSPLTYEGMLEMFRETDRKIQRVTEQQLETDRKMQETDRRMKETDRMIKATSREIGKLSSRVGEIIENMVGGGNIVAQFRALGHDVNAHSREKYFGVPGTDTSGEIDLFLEDGNTAILIEVKTKLKTDDIHEHVERMEKYRSWVNTKGGDKMHYIGAVAGAVVEDNVVKFAQKNGFYVIVQSGNAFEIVAPPEGFEVKKW